MTPQPSAGAQTEQSPGTETWAQPAPASSPPRANPVQAATEVRPEIAVGAAFAAGFVVAKIVRRVAG